MKDLILQLIIKARDQASAVLDTVKSKSGQTTRAIQTDSESAARGVDKLSSSFDNSAASVAKWASAYFGLQKIKDLFASVLDVGGRFEALDIRMRSLMGGIAEGREAVAWIKDFEQKVPQDIEGVTKSFQTLKSFGIDPTNGSLQALADQTAAVGGTSEDLVGIARQLGQAWSKEKLQGEDILSLIDRGVPVWKLLADATGLTARELAQMATNGDLGRDAIQALIDEMGRQNFGAAAAQMDAFGGATSNAGSEIKKFLNDIAEAGVLDFATSKIKAFTATIQEMRASGELGAWASAFGKVMTFVGGVVIAVGKAIDFFIIKPLEWIGSTRAFDNLATVVETVAGFVGDVLGVSSAQENVTKAVDESTKAAEELKNAASETYNSMQAEAKDAAKTIAEADTQTADKIKQNAEEILKAKKDALKQEIDAKKEYFALLERSEKLHAEKAKEYQKELADIQKKSVENSAPVIKAFDGFNDSPTVQLNDLLANASKLNAGVNAALDVGDYEKAVEEAKKVEIAFNGVAGAAKTAFDQGLIDQNSLDVALYDLEKASNQVQDLLGQAANAEQAQADELAQWAAQEKAALDEKIAQLQEVDALSKDKEFAIDVKTDSLDSALAKLQDLESRLSNYNASIGAAAPGNVPGYAAGVRLPGFGGGDRHLSLLESGEGVLNKYALRKLDTALGPAFFNGLNAGHDPINLLSGAGVRGYADGGRIFDLASFAVPSFDFSSPGFDFAGLTAQHQTPAVNQAANYYISGRKIGPVYAPRDTAQELAQALDALASRAGR